jgi:hypothetical protein
MGTANANMLMNTDITNVSAKTFFMGRRNDQIQPVGEVLSAMRSGLPKRVIQI